MFIFALTEGCNVGRPSDTMAPVFIGLSVSSIICFDRSIDTGGAESCRDFGPRLVSWLAGWGEVAFPDACCGGFFFCLYSGPYLGRGGSGLCANLCDRAADQSGETVRVSARVIIIINRNG